MYGQQQRCMETWKILFRFYIISSFIADSNCPRFDRRLIERSLIESVCLVSNFFRCLKIGFFLLYLATKPNRNLVNVVNLLYHKSVHIDREQRVCNRQHISTEIYFVSFVFYIDLFHLTKLARVTVLVHSNWTQSYSVLSPDNVASYHQSDHVSLLVIENVSWMKVFSVQYIIDMNLNWVENAKITFLFQQIVG